MRAASPHMTRHAGRVSLAAVTAIAALSLLAACGRSAGGNTAAARWSAPVKLSGVQALAAISCPTAAFCMAVGNRIAVRWSNGAWSAPVAIDGHAPASGGLSTVSCSSATFCVASDGEGNAFVYNGTEWSAPQRATDNGLVSLSCSSPSFCGALDSVGDALFYDGSSWSTPRAVTGASQGVSISCLSSSFCMAVDGGATGAFRYSGSSWASAGSLNVSTPAGGSEPNVASAVSCSTQTTCAALDNFGEAFTWVGGKWSGAFQFDQDLMDGNDALSCPSASFCMVVDSDGIATSWNGTSWSPGARIDGVNSGLSDVSCPSAGRCVAVDGSGRVLTYR
jgi:hypothetical protein